MNQEFDTHDLRLRVAAPRAAVSCEPQTIVVEGAAARGQWLGLDGEGWLYGPALVLNDQPEIVAATADAELQRVAFATRGGRVGVGTISRMATARRLMASRPSAPRMLGALTSFWGRAGS